MLVEAQYMGATIRLDVKQCNRMFLPLLCSGKCVTSTVVWVTVHEVSLTRDALHIMWAYLHTESSIK